MERYDNLDLELECDDGGGGVSLSQKAKLFGGMLKRSSKSAEQSVQAQESLSANSELSKSDDSLTDNSTKEKGGVFKGMFKKTTKAAKDGQSQDLLDSELTASNDSLSDKTAAKESGGMFSGMFKKSPKRTQSQEDLSAPGELSGSTDDLSENNNTKDDLSADGELSASSDNLTEKSSKGETAAKFLKNPFNLLSQEKEKAEHSGDSSENTSTTEKHKSKQRDREMLKENEKQVEEKPKVVKSNMIQRERKERSETPQVPPRPTEEEMKGTSTHSKVKPRGAEDNQEMNIAARHRLRREKSHHQGQSDDEGLSKDEAAERDEANQPDSKATKVKKHRHNPFMPRAGAKAPSDDEGLKDEDDSSSKEEKKEEEGKEKTETKVKRPKKHNPFMPQVKGRIAQRHAQDGAADNTQNEGGNRSLFDQLEDFRIKPARPEDAEDLDLMEWWNTVESWEDTPQVDDMTEKEEAKAFSVTAEKVQKGIRIFNKLFSERAESLWQHVIDLNSIADGLDKFSKNTKIAQITGGSTSAIGGVATIAGLALAPVTMGTSLIVTAVGLGVATAGGLTSAGAGISNQVNNSMDRKKVEKIVQDYQEKMADLNKCLKFVKQGMENLKKFDLLKLKKHTYNRDFPVLSSSFYKDGAMAGKAILINANEIMRVVQIANVAGSTAARAVQIASMATGVLTGLFVGMDIYFVAKDSKELKKGAKSEFAAKIREVATQLHDGLVELNTIREELQATEPENSSGNETAAAEGEKAEKENKYDSSDEEDEIDRIKKAIKKDMESREYV